MKTMTSAMLAAAAALMMTGCAGDPDLVGTWADSDFQLTVHGDGTLRSTRLDGSEPESLGTWTLDRDLFRNQLHQPGSGLTGPIEFSFASTYYVSADQLATAALLPVGAHRGLIGTWKGRQAFWFADETFEEKVFDTTLELRADHGCTRTRSFDGLKPCTWSQDASGGVILDIAPGELALQLIDDQALSSQVSKRIN